MSDSCFPMLQAIQVITASPLPTEMVILATQKETAVNGKDQKVFMWVGNRKASSSTLCP